MRRAVVCALLTSALSVPAWAGPLQIAPDAGAAPPDPGAAQPQRYAAQQSNLGGGFIQMLFGGAPREAAVPRAYQPIPDEQRAPRGYQPAAAQPDYGPQQQAAAPDSGPDQAPAPRPQRLALFGSLFGDASYGNASYGNASYGNTPPQSYAPVSQGETAHPPVDPRFDRQVVDYRSTEKPGTIVIDTPNHFLYLVQENGKAMRYGIGVGRPGFTWQGVKTISAKKEWPDWFPPTEMIERRPDLPRWMAGGPENPLGARAMYLGSTLYRIHGSNEPWTIGGNVSSGCIRLRNADIIDLYSRVQVGTRVVVM
jgi:lipoprotein-anchoring transpeptidase ErfK/SrfK